MQALLFYIILAKTMIKALFYHLSKLVMIRSLRVCRFLFAVFGGSSYQVYVALGQRSP